MIMKIGGWGTRSVFERYAIVNRNDIADAMQKLQNTEAELQIGTQIGHEARKRKPKCRERASISS